MSAAKFAMLVTAVGFVSLVVGLALSPAWWLAPVVGGILLVALGLSIDEPRRRGPQ